MIYFEDDLSGDPQRIRYQDEELCSIFPLETLSRARYSSRSSMYKEQKKVKVDPHAIHKGPDR